MFESILEQGPIRESGQVVVEGLDEAPSLLAQWHAHLDAVSVSLDGDQPHTSTRKLHALEDFYRATLTGSAD